MYKLLSFLLFLCISTASHAAPRDYISIAGSSTVLPFATIIAEQFGRNPNYKTPVVESGGSSIGKKSVCDGTGLRFIDIGNASSRMKKGELEYCQNNGIKLSEIKVGYDGIVVANSKKGIPLNITRVDLGKALTALVPSDDGTKMIPNHYKKWSDINPLYPDIDIRVYGPPTTSGTRASFTELVNENGYCRVDPIAKKVLENLNEDPKICRAMRTDGAYIEAGEQDNLIVKKLLNDKDTYGIFGFSYLDQNSDTLQGAIVDGANPTYENISDGNYSISRALYMYVKHKHVDVIPGMREFLKEWTRHWGEEGLLSDSGMIPLSYEERTEYSKVIHNLPKLTIEMLE